MIPPTVTWHPFVSFGTWSASRPYQGENQTTCDITPRFPWPASLARLCQNFDNLSGQTARVRAKGSPNPGDVCATNEKVRSDSVFHRPKDGNPQPISLVTLQGEVGSWKI